MGIIAAADAATRSSSSSLTFPILIVLGFVGFYFLMIRPQRRRQQQVAHQQNTAVPGVEVRYLKRAIQEVVPPAEEETFEDGENFEATDDAFEDDEPATDDETPGTQDTVNGVGSGDEGLADAHDGELAKADKDNVH